MCYPGLTISKDFAWIAGSEASKQYDDRDTSTGEVVHHWFCTNYGSPMLTQSPRMPGVKIIPIDIFDGQHKWQPNYEQWRCSRVCFVDDIRGIKEKSRYEGFPDVEECARVWEAYGTLKQGAKA